jgi:succinate dehydrogenase flavin-adding protein (antitoxin of CptAB toxin-antitoxin module)
MAMKFSVSFSKKDKDLYNWIMKEYVCPAAQAKQLFAEARKKKESTQQPHGPGGLSSLDF